MNPQLSTFPCRVLPARFNPASQILKAPAPRIAIGKRSLLRAPIRYDADYLRQLLRDFPAGAPLGRERAAGLAEPLCCVRRPFTKVFVATGGDQFFFDRHTAACFRFVRGATAYITSGTRPPSPLRFCEYYS